MKKIIFLLLIVGCAPSINKSINDSGAVNSNVCYMTSIEERPKAEFSEFQTEIDDFFSSQHKSDLLYIHVVSGRTDKNILKRIFFDGDSLRSYLIGRESRKSSIRINDESIYNTLIRQLLSGHYLQTCTRFSSVDNLVIVIVKKNGQVDFSADYDNLFDLNPGDKEKFSTLIDLDNYMQSLMAGLALPN